MAKRIKKKSNSRSMLKLESLEQRQLLATIVGDGVSLDTWQDLSNKGNTYDQVLMTGSSVTVSADEGQWVRTSFVDLSGDIVQVDFTGAGTLNISLSNFSGPAEAANYNQPGIEYVSGLASFTIQGADASTHFAIYSVGKGVNQGVIAEGKEGGNHWADVQRLTIVADPSNPNGSTFGSIRMGNAIFGGSEGAVGIAATNVHVQDTVVIGDIDAKGAATPQLVFGGASQFGSVRIAGGDLLQSNGNSIDNSSSSGQDSYVYDVSFIAGAGSDVVVENGVVVEGAIKPAAVLDGAVEFDAAVGFITTLDSTTEIDITGLNQAQINALFAGRTFTNDLTITGDLKAGFEIFVEAFRGDVTFDGDILGDITFTDQNASNPASSGFSGSLTVLGDVAGTIDAEKIGDVEIDGDFSGLLLADEVGGGVDAIPGGIGNVTVSGDFSGQIDSDWGVGDVWVGGNLTSGGDAIITRGDTPLYQGNVGNVTVKGDVNQGGGLLINIDGEGTFGDVVIEGAGELATMNIGGIYVESLGAGQDSTGSVTVTDTAGNADIVFAGIWLDDNDGAIGDVSITGSGVIGADFDLDGAISGASVGSVTIAGFGTIGLNAAVDANDGDVGDISLTTVAGSKTTGSSISLNADIEGDNVGDITLDAGAEFSTITVAAAVDIGDGDSVGGLTLVGATVNLMAGSSISAATVGDLSVTGTTVTAAGTIGSADDALGGIMIAAETVTISGSILGESAGDLTVTADKTVSLSGDIDVDTLGDVSIAGDTTVTGTGSILTETVGDLTFTGDTVLQGDSSITADTAGLITFDGKLTAESGAVTSNLTLDTADAVVVTGAADIEDKGAANIVVTGTVGGLHFQDATTLTGNVLNSTAGLLDGSGSANGTALLFTKLTANGGNLLTASVGNLVFNGNTDLGGGGFLVADDGEATLDVVGDITFNGKVVSSDADLDIRASSVGDINLTMALNLTDQVAVKDLNVFAGQNAKEAVSKDGSNLSSYTIGDITVVDTQTKGFAGLSLFSGVNSFDALGAVGDVTLTGGGTENQQTALFSLNTDSLRVTAGVYATPGTLMSTSGIDFDANGTIGTVVDGDDADTDPDVDPDEVGATLNFSDGAVSVGDVTIHARAVNPGTGDVDNVVNASGLLVAAGIGTGLAANTAADLDASLEGTIGDILISNNSQVLTVADDADKDAVPSGLFLAATGVGTVQTLDKDAALAVGVVIGNQAGGFATEGEANEFVVIVV